MIMLAAHALVTSLLAVAFLYVGAVLGAPIGGFFGMAAILIGGFIDMLRRSRNGEFDL